MALKGLVISASNLLSKLPFSRQGLGLGYFVPVDGQESVTDPAFAGLSNATSQICFKKVPCIQASTGDRLTLYRFASQSDAAQFVQLLGDDGYQSDWIVVEFTDQSLSPELRLYVKETLDGVWGWD